MKTIDFNQAIQATMTAFDCDAVVVIPIYANSARYPKRGELPALYGNLNPEAVDWLLQQKGVEAQRNIDKRIGELPSLLKTDSKEYWRLLDLGFERLKEFEESET